MAHPRPAFVWPVVIVVTAVVCVVVGSLCGRGANLGRTATAAVAPSAPPPVVFAVVWGLLYAAVGVGAAYQGLTSTSAAHWVSLALLASTVVVSWAWPTIWAQAQRTNLPAAAPTWTIGAMLLVGGTGLALVPNQTSAALWAPYVLWLVIALGLSMQAQTGAQSNGIRNKMPTA